MINLSIDHDHKAYAIGLNQTSVKNVVLNKVIRISETKLKQTVSLISTSDQGSLNSNTEKTKYVLSIPSNKNIHT